MAIVLRGLPAVAATFSSFLAISAVKNFSPHWLQTQASPGLGHIPQGFQKGLFILVLLKLLQGHFEVNLGRLGIL